VEEKIRKGMYAVDEVNLQGLHMDEFWPLPSAVIERNNTWTLD
jgi:hypothetical protein